jgi:hypothetical protein
MEDYLAHVAGPGSTHIREALRRTLDGGLDFVPDSDTDFREQAAQHLRTLSPQRYELAGDEGIGKLIDHGLRTAESYQSVRRADHALAITLMYGLGHGCFDDLRFPWISETLTQDAALPTTDRFDALRDLAKEHAQRTFEGLGGGSES